MAKHTDFTGMETYRSEIALLSMKKQEVKTSLLDFLGDSPEEGNKNFLLIATYLEERFLKLDKNIESLKKLFGEKNEDMALPDILPLEKVQKALGYSRKSMYNLITKDKAIPVIQIGRKTFVTRTALTEFFNAHSRNINF